MAYEIYTYVSDLVADYTTILDITPQKVLTETVDKKQKIHEYDSGAVDVVNISNTLYCDITLQWDIVTEAEAGLILDYYADTAKANARAKTFYITLPDAKTYTVRFLGPLVRVVTPGLMAGGYRSISQLRLRVEGRKP